MKSNFIYITTDIKQVIQLILITLIVTDICVCVIFILEFIIKLTLMLKYKIKTLVLHEDIFPFLSIQFLR